MVRIHFTGYIGSWSFVVFHDGNAYVAEATDYSRHDQEDGYHRIEVDFGDDLAEALEYTSYEMQKRLPQ